jgi:hypothetical protein
MILLLELVTQQSPWYLMPALLWVVAIALQLILALCLYLREQFFMKRRLPFLYTFTPGFKSTT